MAQEKASEFGGYPGEIQPPPHELDAAEKARIQRRIPSAGAEALTTDDEMAARYMATGGEAAEGV